jgi:hypothetical protein
MFSRGLCEITCYEVLELEMWRVFDEVFRKFETKTSMIKCFIYPNEQDSAFWARIISLYLWNVRFYNKDQLNYSLLDISIGYVYFIIESSQCFFASLTL